jgi:hypothetical protein
MVDGLHIHILTRMRKPLATALSGGGEGVAVVGEMVG